MPLVRISKKDYGNTRSILAIPDHYVALPFVVNASDAETVNGKKVFRAGTPVKDLGNDTVSIVDVKSAPGQDIAGLIFNDQEVYEGEEKVTVTVLVHGFVAYNSLAKVSEHLPKSTFTPMIQVVK